MTVELVPKMKRSHPRCSRHAEGLFGMEWIGSVVPRLSAFALSISLNLIVSSFLSLHITLLAVCLSLLAYALLSSPPSVLVYLPPTRSVGADSSGVAVAEIFGRLWLIGWRQRRKRSWQDWPEILRAERSSNPYRRQARTNPPS